MATLAAGSGSPVQRHPAGDVENRAANGLVREYSPPVRPGPWRSPPGFPTASSTASRPSANSRRAPTGIPPVQPARRRFASAIVHCATRSAVLLVSPLRASRGTSAAAPARSSAGAAVPSSSAPSPCPRWRPLIYPATAGTGAQALLQVDSPAGAMTHHRGRPRDSKGSKGHRGPDALQLAVPGDPGDTRSRPSGDRPHQRQPGAHPGQDGHEPADRGGDGAGPAAHRGARGDEASGAHGGTGAAGPGRGLPATRGRREVTGGHGCRSPGPGAPAARGGDAARGDHGDRWAHPPGPGPSLEDGGAVAAVGSGLGWILATPGQPESIAHPLRGT